mgnify:CR=1 FL=1
MTERRDVTVFYDERVLNHAPDVNAAFLPGRLDKRVRTILAGLTVQWKYPEHPGRIHAILDLLKREQLARVHTTSFLDDLFLLRNKNAWLDVVWRQWRKPRRFTSLYSPRSLLENDPVSFPVAGGDMAF